MVPNLGHRCLAQLPEHAHDVQLALGQMQVDSHQAGNWMVRALVIVQSPSSGERAHGSR